MCVCVCVCVCACVDRSKKSCAADHERHAPRAPVGYVLSLSLSLSLSLPLSLSLSVTVVRLAADKEVTPQNEALLRRHRHLLEYVYIYQ